MDDLLVTIGRHVKCDESVRDDFIQEVALLVLTGRIDSEDIPGGIKRHSAALRKAFPGSQWSLSLDAPISSDTTLTFKDVIATVAVQGKRPCPQCRRKVKPKRVFCSPTCACKYFARLRRKVDPEELRHLNKERWLTRQQMADALGVKPAAINSAIFRHGLSRLRPTVCRVHGCGEMAVKFRHIFGYQTGTLCIKHKREAAVKYARAHRQRTTTPCTAEQRSENARKASLARWAKTKGLVNGSSANARTADAL